MNNQWNIKIERFGHEQQPIIIIDNFASNPSAIIADAASRKFGQHGPYYPGIRALVPPPLVSQLIRGLQQMLAETFANDDYKVLESYYSLVTTPPGQLLPIQRLPHFDGLEADRLALLYYLSPTLQGGTAFYRHKVTGYETVTAERYDRFSKALATDVQTHGLPPANYISGSTAIYDQLTCVEAQYNRAIIYRSTTLHSANIPENSILSSDVYAGRLTMNIFLTGMTQ